LAILFKLFIAPKTLNYLTAGGLLVPEGIIRQVVSASPLTWFIDIFITEFTVPK